MRLNKIDIRLYNIFEYFWNIGNNLTFR